MYQPNSDNILFILLQEMVITLYSYIVLTVVKDVAISELF